MPDPSEQPQATATFDSSRVVELHENKALETDADKPRFIATVRDYMAWARSVPVDHDLTELEKAVAVVFADAIRSVKAWPLAKQTVHLFKNPPTSQELENLSAPLKHVIKALVDDGLVRLHHPRFGTHAMQREQEDFMWQNMQAQIRYIGYYGGIAEATPPARLREVEETIARLGEVVQRYGLPLEELGGYGSVELSSEEEFPDGPCSEEGSSEEEVGGEGDAGVNSGDELGP